jgi:hypothetical protein
MRRFDDDEEDAATVELVTKRDGEMVLSTKSMCDFECFV